MIPEPQRNLAKYRLDLATENLNAAKALIEQKFYKDSVNRSYYAIFLSARALLAIKELDSQKHSGVISLFNQHYVKMGILSKECGHILKSAKEYREEAHYGDFIEITEEVAKEQVKNAEFFLVEVRKYYESLLKT